MESALEDAGVSRETAVATIAVRPGDPVDLFARVQNLLNEGYAEVRGFPALGINGLLGLRATFQ